MFKQLLIALVLIGFGIAMISSPDLMEGATASGRNSLAKSLLIAVWGTPGGVVSLLAGLGLGGFTFMGSPRQNELERKVAPRKRS